MIGSCSALPLHVASVVAADEDAYRSAALGTTCPAAVIVDAKEKSDYVLLLTSTWGPVGKTTSFLLFTRDGEPLGGDSPVSIEEAVAKACEGIRRHRAGERPLPTRPNIPAAASMPSPL